VRRNVHWTAVLLVASLFVASCAAGRAFRRGDRAAMAGDWDAAASHYRTALQEDPDRADYKIALERAMQNASRFHLTRAREFEDKNQLEEALFEYRKASEYNPTNRMAAAKAAALERSVRERAEAARPKPRIEQMREQARQAAAPPLLNPASRDLLRVKFVNASLRDILNFIAVSAGINITYDTQVVDHTYTVDLDGVSLEDALSQILGANTLFHKVLNERTVIVVPDNQAKRAQYEEQVIRTFYLSHADPSEVAQILNTVIRLPQMSVQPQIAFLKSSNSITVRASIAVADIIERIIRANDKPRAEIVIDVQILEVNRNRARQFGLNLSDYALGGIFSPEVSLSGTSAAGAAAGTSPGGVSSPPPINLRTFSGISTADFYLAVPTAIVRFLESDSETKLIAKPQLRGAEGQKLLLNLGDEIPVPSTTFTPLAAGGSVFNPLTSFAYKPVGVNVTMNPRVTLEGEIVLELEVESSTLGRSISIAGQDLPTFGSRKVTTKLRLRDGESNLLAGLLREDERRSARGFPGLLRLPVFRQLFSSNDNSVAQTDIVMLLTPHIVRTSEIEQADLNPIFIGTQQNLGLTGAPPLIAPQPEQPTAVGGAPATPAPMVPVLPPGSSPIPGTTTAPAAPSPQPTPVAPTTTPQPAPTTPTPAAPTTTTETPAAPATSPALQPGAAHVVLTPPGAEFRVGAGPYTVPISITGASRVAMIAVTVTYNPAILRVRTVQEGSFMRQGGTAASFNQQVDPASGRIDLTSTRTAGLPGAVGGGVLAAIVFDPIAPGHVTLGSSGVATDSAGAPVPLQFSGVTVTVK
jgi:type II secretory pathway component GspD/PulD (secretin)